MSLTKEEVLKIAKLSKLSFEETEIEKFQVELNDILKYIDMLNEVDTSEVFLKLLGSRRIYVYL